MNGGTWVRTNIWMNVGVRPEKEEEELRTDNTYGRRRIKSG